MLGSRYPSTASFPIVARALTREGFLHVPFGTGIEEGQSIPSLQWFVVGNPDLEFGHVEQQGWTARMIAEDEVGVQFDAAAIAVTLNCRPAWSFAWGC